MLNIWALKGIFHEKHVGFSSILQDSFHHFIVFKFLNSMSPKIRSDISSSMMQGKLRLIAFKKLRQTSFARVCVGRRSNRSKMAAACQSEAAPAQRPSESDVSDILSHMVVYSRLPVSPACVSPRSGSVISRSLQPNG